MALGHIEIRASDDNQHFHYVVVAANGEPLVTSETYTRREDANRGASDLIDALSPAVTVKDGD
jgi:uncharacterized protein YegP (UPF0339 family)